MSNPALICGERVVLRPADPEDRREIFDWLFRSDLTPSMLGPPLYPERPIPPAGDPGEGYAPYYFDGPASVLGRCYLIMVDDERAGQVNYNDIHEFLGRKRVELDIWMRSEAWCGQGFGTDALNALCRHLQEQFGVEEFLVQPSARNPRAIRAYEKARFARLDTPIETASELWGPADYFDSVYMVRSVARNESEQRE
jgi:diamine N-acetyltransferase